MGIKLVRLEKIQKKKLPEIFAKSFIAGIGWAAGATIGFAVLIAFLGWLFARLGALPVVGNIFASIVEATNQALETRKLLR